MCIIPIKIPKNPILPIDAINFFTPTKTAPFHISIYKKKANLLRLKKSYIHHIYIGLLYLNSMCMKKVIKNEIL